MNEFFLESLTIFDLRRLARSYNIKAPTAKKRAELITLIKLAMENKLPKSEMNIGTKGRPVKETLIFASSQKSFIKSIYRDLNKINKEVNRLKEKIKKSIS